MQTAVTWLLQELEKVNYHPTEAMIMYAKKLEKQQIIDAYANGSNDRLKNIVKDYFTETYGSKGSDEYTTVNWGGVIQKIPKKGSGELEQINQDNPITRGSTALVRVTSSQEISDEEIDMAALLNEPRVTRRAFRSGAKWYREQLKKKQ